MDNEEVRTRITELIERHKNESVEEAKRENPDECKLREEFVHKLINKWKAQDISVTFEEILETLNSIPSDVLGIATLNLIDVKIKEYDKKIHFDEDDDYDGFDISWEWMQTVVDSHGWEMVIDELRKLQREIIEIMDGIQVKSEISKKGEQL